MGNGGVAQHVWEDVFDKLEIYKFDRVSLSINKGSLIMEAIDDGEGGGICISDLGDASLATLASILTASTISDLAVHGKLKVTLQFAKEETA